MAHVAPCDNATDLRLGAPFIAERWVGDGPHARRLNFDDQAPSGRQSVPHPSPNSEGWGTCIRNLLIVSLLASAIVGHAVGAEEATGGAMRGDHLLSQRRDDRVVHLAVMLIRGRDGDLDASLHVGDVAAH